MCLSHDREHRCHIQSFQHIFFIYVKSVYFHQYILEWQEHLASETWKQGVMNVAVTSLLVRYLKFYNYQPVGKVFLNAEITNLLARYHGCDIITLLSLIKLERKFLKSTMRHRDLPKSTRWWHSSCFFFKKHFIWNYHAKFNENWQEASYGNRL